jgi:peptidase YpeB-like protein
MRKRVVVAAGATALVAAVVAGGVAAASSGDEPGSGNVSRQQAEDATQAALKATGGGHANSVERDGENGATWEVEVTRTDGQTVDVRLDDSYHVVVIESDHEDASGS